VVAPDPVDIRLLSLVAESGKAAVHDIAARLGMDPREVASRLVALSGAGLPLIVGVECDPYGLRNAIAGAGAYLNQQNLNQQSGPYPPPQQQQPPPQQRGYGPGVPSGPYPAPMAQQRPPVQAPPRPDPMSTWGPPQTSSWARGDQPTRPAWTAPPSQATATPAPSPSAPTGSQRGGVGETLYTDGPDGEQVAIRLVEVVDPADFLFTAAGYRLREGERSVVVHTELTNRGSAPFATLPDLYLVLVAKDGQTVGKAPVSLSSRPPHRIGVRPGETEGGHTVYVLPETTDITSIRWTARPEEEQHVLTWTVQP
jgi:DNA-binding Lrp family transcriptional regulator